MRRIKFRGYLLVPAFLSAILSGVAVAPSAAEALTLREAIRHAYGTNPLLKAAQANYDATQHGVTRSDSVWYPTLSASADYGFTESEATAERIDMSGSSTTVTRMETRADREPATLSLVASQNIFAGGAHWAGSRRARALSQAAFHDLRQTTQQILLDAATAYFNVLRDQSIVQLNKNNVTVLTRQLEAVLQRYQVGEITRTDVAQSESRLSGAQSALVASRAALTQSRSFFRRVIGLPPKNLSFASLPQIPNSRAELSQIARRNHPNISAAIARTQAAQAQRGTAIAALLPSINLEARYSYAEDPADQVLESESTVVTARLTVPIFQGFGLWAGMGEASRQLERSRFQEANVRRQIDELVSNSWDALSAARARIKSDTKQEIASRIAYEGVRQEANVGSRTTLDVLNAQQELLNAQVTLATSRREEQVATYRLLSAAGLLTANNLRLSERDRPRSRPRSSGKRPSRDPRLPR